jgi:O-antigen/teichoic acid export membrane protein
MLALVLLVNLDLVLARHYLPAHEAGEYAVGAIVAKIAYWLPQAVAILVLPRFASEHGRRRMVPIALAVCGALDLVVVAGAAGMGPTVVGVIGGGDYAGIPVWPFALVGSMLSLVQILMYARIASNDRRSTLLIWGAVAVEIVLVAGWLHSELTRVVTAAVIATGTLVCAGALVELRSRREPVDTSRDDGRHGEEE